MIVYLRRDIDLDVEILQLKNIPSIVENILFIFKQTSKILLL